VKRDVSQKDSTLLFTIMLLKQKCIWQTQHTENMLVNHTFADTKISSAQKYKKVITHNMYNASGPLQPIKASQNCTESRQNQTSVTIHRFHQWSQSYVKYSDRTGHPWTNQQPANGNKQEESQMWVILNEWWGDIATIFVVTVAYLQPNSVCTPSFETPTTLSGSNVSKHSTLPYVADIPFSLIVCYKQHWHDIPCVQLTDALWQ